VAVALGIGLEQHTVPSVAPRAVNPAVLARAAGERFLARYERPNGQVVRTDQGGDTVSEGQAYAMLVSVALGDRRRFDAAWTWAYRHLELRNGLLASRWAGGHVVDRQPATDADLDAAWALALAAQRFHAPTGTARARLISRAILAHDTFTISGQPWLAAGPWALTQRIVDPSYYSPAGFATLARVDRRDAHRWAEAALTSRRSIARLTQGGKLPPDWAQVTAAGRPIPIGSPSQPASPPRYSFDAARIPVRYAAACGSADRRLAASLWPALKQAGSPTPFALNLSGAALVNDSHPVPGVAASAAAASASDAQAATQRLDHVTTLDAHYPTYYGAAWTALGRILLTTHWLGGSCPPIPAP
jgi:endo-1,4-beta-D-glucanase Y